MDAFLHEVNIVLKLPTLAALLAVIGALGTSSSVSADGSAMIPRESDSFVDSIGVDTHFNYNNTPYVQMWPAISSQLVASGIRHIRDGGKPTSQYLARLNYLGEHGIKHAAGFDIHSTSDQIRSRLAAFAPYVDFVEPANEYDHYRNQDSAWASELADEQRLLYTTVHGDPAYAGITVLGPAMATHPLYGELGNLEQFEDAGNIHNGTCNKNPGTDGHAGMVFVTAQVRKSTPTKPIWTTETGYNDDPVRPCAIPDDIIAKYDPRTVAERFNFGQPKTYFYQLANMPEDRVFGGQGLLFEDGNPKPQFTALTSMIALLTDRGPDFQVQPVNITIDAPPTVHHTLLEKRTGVYELLLWVEEPAWKPISYNNVGGVRIPVATQSVVVHTPASLHVSRYYTYNPAWQLTGSLANQTPRGDIRLDVTDSMSILELR